MAHRDPSIWYPLEGPGFGHASIHRQSARAAQQGPTGRQPEVIHRMDGMGWVPQGKGISVGIIVNQKVTYLWVKCVIFTRK